MKKRNLILKAILGHSDDPAHIQGQGDAAAALAGIAKAEALFISRGDDSGTHTKEQALWKISGVALEVRKTEILKKGKKTEICFAFPENSMAWYISIGQGMGKTIIYADEKQAYTLSEAHHTFFLDHGKLTATQAEHFKSCQ